MISVEHKFVYLDHTADAKFRAFGRDIEEAFVNAALATANLMWDYEEIEPKVEHTVEVVGRDLEQLVFKFLTEILYLLEAKAFLLGAVENLSIFQEDSGEYRLNVRFLGDTHSEKYSVHGEVKAITYSDMKIEKDDHVPWTLQVVVDM